jgi:hypothetical protein
MCENIIKPKIKKNRPVMMDERSHQRLMWISKVTGKSQKGILEEFITELFSLSINYDKATLRIDSSILNDSVTAVLHGYGNKLQFGTCKTEFDLTQITTDKIISDLTKKANGIDI